MVAYAGAVGEPTAHESHVNQECAGSTGSTAARGEQVPTDPLFRGDLGGQVPTDTRPWGVGPHRHPW
eukprot:9213821-Alexandrium_andersonii.AAC.1